MHKVYILYSNTFDKFYVGETQNIAVRLEQHNQGFYQNSFTGFTNDWILQLELTVSNRVEARTIERYIKSMKSKKFIKSLVNDEQFLSNFKKLVFDKFQISIL